MSNFSKETKRGKKAKRNQMNPLETGRVNREPNEKQKEREADRKRRERKRKGIQKREKLQ